MGTMPPINNYGHFQCNLSGSQLKSLVEENSENFWFGTQTALGVGFHCVSKLCPVESESPSAKELWLMIYPEYTPLNLSSFHLNVFMRISIRYRNGTVRDVDVSTCNSSEPQLAQWVKSRTELFENDITDAVSLDIDIQWV